MLRRKGEGRRHNQLTNAAACGLVWCIKWGGHARAANARRRAHPSSRDRERRLESARVLAQACPCPAPGPGRPGPAARSQHYLFHGFQLTRENKATKRPKDKSMCARRDAIAQRCSPGLASNRSIVKPLSPPPRHTCMVQAEHPSPSARQFRLLPNGLAISELRRMLSPKRAHPSSRVCYRSFN
jgi:hypothetical protein